MNTLSVNQTEPNFTEANFERILVENRKILFDKILKLDISEENQEKILVSVEDYNNILIDKYNEDLEHYQNLKQLNKDLIFLESIKKTLVDKLVLSYENNARYEQIEKNISK